MYGTVTKWAPPRYTCKVSIRMLDSRIVGHAFTLDALAQLPVQGVVKGALAFVDLSVQEAVGCTSPTSSDRSLDSHTRLGRPVVVLYLLRAKYQGST